MRSTQSARDNFRPRTGKPCDDYKVDTKAEVFGNCLCGFPKDAHVEKEENHAAQALREMKEKNKKKNEVKDLRAAGRDEEAALLEAQEKKARMGAGSAGPKNTGKFSREG